MRDMPDTRALLGVDVIGSASNPGYHRDALWGELSQMLRTALTESGITPDEVKKYEPTGDGALYAFSAARLGTAVDLSDRLGELAADRNRWEKPDIRLRIAVEIGAVGDGTGYYSPTIWLTRLLGADAFKHLVNECISANTDRQGNSPISSALIVSQNAFRSVFGGDYTKVRETDFAELTVANKEFSEPAYVRIPGVDARTIAELATRQPATASQETDETARGSVTVRNTSHGPMKDSFQIGVVHGGVHHNRYRH